MWAKLKLRMGLWMVRLGLMTGHLICNRCGCEVAIENWERHEAAFHADEGAVAAAETKSSS